MNQKYTCGKCDRIVSISLPKPDDFYHLKEAALFCPKCDDIFCIACGFLKMADNSSAIPCGNCGGDAFEINDIRHPSWFPGKKPIK